MATTAIVDITLDGFGANAHMEINTDDGFSIHFDPYQRREGGFGTLGQLCNKQQIKNKIDLKAKHPNRYATCYYATRYIFPANEMGVDLRRMLNDGQLGTPTFHHKSRGSNPEKDN